MGARPETDLYGPVRDFLAGQGYDVRGEVSGCDLVAVRGDDVVVVELKARFTLDLVLQGVARQEITDTVYLAVEAPRRTSTGRRWAALQRLCRRLGLGLMTVRFTRRPPAVEVWLDPGPYTPRRSPRRRSLLLREFQLRSADHNTGGSTRRPVVTAYREEALRVASYLHRAGPSRVAAVRAAAGAPRAGAILRRNVYGWFERTGRGIYVLTPRGEQALALFAGVVATLAAPGTPGE